MRIIVSIALPIVLCACSQSPDQENSDGRTSLERLKAGDTGLCADPQIQLSALKIIADNLYLGAEFKRMVDKGETLKWSEASSEGLDQAVPQLACSANLLLNGAFFGDRKFKVEWKLRPNLSKKQDLIIETTVPGDTETFTTFMKYTMLGKYGPERQLGAQQEVSEEESETVPSRQAEFAADHPNEADCGTPDQVSERLKNEGLSLVETGDDGTEIWKTQDDSRTVSVDSSPMESCIVNK